MSTSTRLQRLEKVFGARLRERVDPYPEVTAAFARLLSVLTFDQVTELEGLLRPDLGVEDERRLAAYWDLLEKVVDAPDEVVAVAREKAERADAQLRINLILP
ncbi:hypothetical protein GIW81_02060 [Hyphomicrobium sp. xq]|uniref:Uncharacterized protein n=1 Tax=Hyphomicrobium album TaxID=2665159 RepID=A0A6I3KE23_9HYPH|nr:hypothetical protein [Hyphomicrobium album]MTD93114.1 hypothetical protein [Hyphomicrobium album]